MKNNITVDRPPVVIEGSICSPSVKGKPGSIEIFELDGREWHVGARIGHVPMYRDAPQEGNIGLYRARSDGGEERFFVISDRHMSEVFVRENGGYKKRYVDTEPLIMSIADAPSINELAGMLMEMHRFDIAARLAPFFSEQFDMLGPMKRIEAVLRNIGTGSMLEGRLAQHLVDREGMKFSHACVEVFGALNAGLLRKNGEDGEVELSKAGEDYLRTLSRQ